MAYMNQINVSRTPMGDNNYAVYGRLVGKMLARAIPNMPLEKFAQAFVYDRNSGDTAIFMRFELLDSTPQKLIEGVTPNAKEITTTHIESPLEQYGDYILFSDKLNDTNDINFVENAATVLGEQAAEAVERLRISTLLSGTNVIFATGASRADVNTPITANLMNRVERALWRQEAKFITSPIASSPRFYTENIPGAFVAVVHPDLIQDIRNLPGFKAPWDYGTPSDWEGEVGAYNHFRFLTTTLLRPWADAGGAAAGPDGTMISTSGANADVYPMIVLARDAFGTVVLRGAEVLKPRITMPSASIIDPLWQRGAISWKTLTTTVILNQAWMIRVEVAASAA